MTNYAKITVMILLLITSFIALSAGKQLSMWFGETAPLSARTGQLSDIDAQLDQLEFHRDNRIHQICHA